ncbi:MAG TPA: hypothetical protein VLM42_06880 [Bryobacteraceae bacterium]|nr:hypothetical protein [Bryobacteraceae bacterium]
MSSFLILLVAASLTMGQSFPRSWTYVAPDATALVGFEWQHLRDSFLAEAVTSELSSSGRLGFPDLACLWNSREILLAGPDLLAVATGSFPPATVAAQATSLGMQPMDYDGVRLWIARAKDRRSFAQVNENLLLIGYKETLEAAIDRSLLTTGRQMSPLLARGARLAASFDMWISATALPDPLVSVFIPVDLETADFDGGLTARNGLILDAHYSMGTPEGASQSADYFRQSIPDFHSLLGRMNVIEDGELVRLKLQVSPQELADQLRPPEPEKTATVEAPSPPVKPRTVHIVGLDDGPSEIPLPAH